MGKVYLPTSEQMETTLENLSRIASALGMKADVSTWKGIQRVVRSGNAPRLFPIGTQLIVHHNLYGDMPYDVVAHDYFKSASDENAHTMTLMCHDLIAGVPFDEKEAFYYAGSYLPKGTYNFTIAETYSSWEAGTYQFTLDNDLPRGSQLCISGDARNPMTTCNVTVFTSQTTLTANATKAITVGNSGTSLGTFGIELNHSHRVSYGSNNYKESAIRQFLNSSANLGTVWTPQTKFDRPSLSSIAGFMKGLDIDFLDCVGEVIVPCATNNIYESPDSTLTKSNKYALVDKFYLASQVEVFGTNTDVAEDDSVVFPYYDGATDTDRVKYKEALSMNWWTRSSISWSAYYVKYIDNKGGSINGGAIYPNGCSPVCTIV